MSRPLTIRAEGERALVIERRFDAPRDLVWRAFTDAALIPKWLWARKAPMTVCEQDFREGGALRWGWALPDGGTMILTGRDVEIAPPGRLVHTELFEQDWTGGETTVTTLLHDLGPVTQMQMTIVYSSRTARDGAAATPMAEGMEEGYARLDSLLPDVAASSG